MHLMAFYSGVAFYRRGYGTHDLGMNSHSFLFNLKSDKIDNFTGIYTPLHNTMGGGIFVNFFAATQYKTCHSEHEHISRSLLK